MKHPLSRDQVEEVWETKDHLPKEEFNVRTFFNLHDLGKSGVNISRTTFPRREFNVRTFFNLHDLG
jgi:hypothetical protein